MSYAQTPSRPTVAGQAVIVWLRPETVAWLQQQGDPERVAATIIGGARNRAANLREPVNRTWHNPAYQKSSQCSAYTASETQPSPARQHPQPKLTTPTAIADPADAANRLILQSGLQPAWSYQRPDTDWHCTLALGEEQHSGTGSSKRAAKRNCCEKLLEAHERCV